jgi:CheY-like chemotaxis protein
MPFSTQKFVLLIDDEDIVAEVFSRVFEGQSYALLDIANTVEKALAKISFITYDYIFLDMKLEGSSQAGMSILRNLRLILNKARSDKRATTESFVVIMTGSLSLQDIMSEANALGVVTFLDKPVSFTEEYLLRIVQRLGLPILPRKSKNG